MAESAKVKDHKGWFTGLGRDGDRSLEQQMTGLDQLLSEVPGKTVIDAGCAEGLVTLKLAEAGASRCVGIEIVGKFVDIAKRLADERRLPCEFVAANLNDYEVSRLARADIVLMLAILHKCKDPSTVCAGLAALALDLCVIRLPPSGPRIIDIRSGMRPHFIDRVMADAGFRLESVVAGPYDEWLGYFRRVVPEKAADVPAESVASVAETIAPIPETNPVADETNAEDPGTPASSDATEGAVHATSEAGDAPDAAADAGQAADGAADDAVDGDAAETNETDKPDEVMAVSTDSVDATGARRRRNRGGSKGSGE